MLIQQKVSRTDFPQKFTPASPREEGVVADAKRPSGRSSSRSKISVQRAKGGPVQCSAASTLLQLLPNMSWTQRQLNYCRLRGVDPHRFQPAKCSSPHQQNTVHWSKKDGVIGKEQMSPVCHRFEPTPHPTSTSESNAAKRKHNPPPTHTHTKWLCWLLLPARQGHNAHLEHRGTKWLPPAMLAVYTPTGCVRLYCQNLFQIHKSTCRHSNNSVSPFIQQDRIYEGIRQI